MAGCLRPAAARCPRAVDLPGNAIFPLNSLFQQPPVRLAAVLLWGCCLLLTAACATPPAALSPQEKSATLISDGETRTLATESRTVREFLEAAGVEIAPADEIDPPLFTPIVDGLTVRIIRVTESIEKIERGIPFGRRIVRSEAMSDEDPPRILQAGRSGLEELTVRIIYRDGIEAERRVTQVTTIEESQDEIIMVGLGPGSAADIVSFDGLIAAINGGAAVLLRGSNAFPEQIDVGGPLDRRVFALSPSGSHLLFTRVTTATTSFNSLWIVGTERGAEPQPLEVENVLWADWNPGRARALEVAYTTGVPTELSPGWEANNDLWLGQVDPEEDPPFEPRMIVDSYPATYGWWGGNYSWSPDGERIGYSFADEIGVIELDGSEDDFIPRRSLLKFSEYDTRADWVWVPSLTWSPDSRFLAFTRHGGQNPTDNVFDGWVVDTASGVNGRLSPNVGIWSTARWAPHAGLDSPIAFLKALDPLDSLRSSYALWLMDSDGSNQRQFYPQPGENSRFPRVEKFMAWNAAGDRFVFVFQDDLYLADLVLGLSQVLLADDPAATHPTWAPYGRGVEAPEPQAEPSREPLPTRSPRDSNLPSSPVRP